MRLQPTWYVNDRIIVSGPRPVGSTPGDGDPALPGLDLLRKVAAEEGYAVVPDVPVVGGGESDDPRARELLAAVDLGDETYAVTLVPEPGRVQSPPEAWDILQKVQLEAGEVGVGPSRDPESWSSVPVYELEHVVSAAPFTQSHPFAQSHPFTQSHPASGLAEYAAIGSGGRQPVMWAGAAPQRRLADGGSPYRAADGTRRPVVAILDTGVGEHPWLGDDVVVRDPQVLGAPIGCFAPPTARVEDSEIGGMSLAPLTGPLDPVAGHGTFIAGLVRQTAPDAAILSCRIYGGAGVVAESDLLRSLRNLLRFHILGLAGFEGYAPVDVVALSFGYYHERPEDAAFDEPFARALRALRRWGVAVVASSGNDGVTRPTFPAAFAPLVDHRSGGLEVVDLREVPRAFAPMATVGALNPDGTTAFFSNDGPWVTTLRPGAGLVSTAPVTLDGTWQATREAPGFYDPNPRATIDPDAFQGGFAVWSGTSFAGPVLAGQIAAYLLGERPGDVTGDAGEVGARAKNQRGRTWSAVGSAVGLHPAAD